MKSKIIKLKNINNWEYSVTDTLDEIYYYQNDLCFITKSGIRFFISPDEDITIERYEGIEVEINFNKAGYVTYLIEV